MWFKNKVSILLRHTDKAKQLKKVLSIISIKLADNFPIFGEDLPLYSRGLFADPVIKKLGKKERFEERRICRRL